jgi:hypothetical protein
MKSKKEFKVGDRVTVSGYCLTPCKADQSELDCNNYLYNKAKGTIKSIADGFDFSYSIWVILNCHIRQLAPLKKKIRKRLWISPDLYKKITDMQESVTYLDHGETKHTEFNIDKINQDQITTVNLAPDTWLEFKEVKKCK